MYGMLTYRLHDTTGDDLGTVEHPAPNVVPVTWSASRTVGGDGVLPPR